MLGGRKYLVRPGGSPGVTLQRVRVRLARGPEAVLVTHLQQIERIKAMFSSTNWPLATSGGRRPRPRISFGPAISVGYLSEAEYCDVELNSRLDLSKAGRELESHLPAGYRFLQVKSIPRFFPSLDESLNLAHYRIRSKAMALSLPHWEAFWQKKNFFVVKKKADKEMVIDARLCVKSWHLANDELDLFVRFGPGRTLKPEKIIQAVCGLSDEESVPGLEESQLRITRVQLFFEKDTGVQTEP